MKTTVETSPYAYSDFSEKKKKKKDKDAPAEELPKDTSYDSDKDLAKVQSFLKQGEVTCVALSINHFLDRLDTVMADPAYLNAQKLYRERCVQEPSGKADLIMTFNKELRTGSATFSFYPLPQLIKPAPNPNYGNNNDGNIFQSTITMSDWGRICKNPSDELNYGGSNDYETRQMVSTLSTSITRAAMECKGQVGVTSETLKAVDAIGERIRGGASSPSTTATPDPCSTKDDGRTAEQRQHDCPGK